MDILVRKAKTNTKASASAAVLFAVVVGEAAGYGLGFGPLVAAKAVMLAALVGINCSKLK